MRLALKKVLAIVLVMFLVLNNISYAQFTNHWAGENYNYFIERGFFQDVMNVDLNRKISLFEFKEIYKKVINQDLLIIHDIKDEDLLTRFDAVKLLADSLEYEGIFNVSLEDYLDSNEIDNNIKSDVNKILSLGILNGYDDNTLQLTERLTFGEAITIIKRVNELKSTSLIQRATVKIPKENTEMGLLSKATNNAVRLFVYGSLLNEKLMNMEYDESKYHEWISLRDEALQVWEEAYKSSLMMVYAADSYINELSQGIDELLSGASTEEYAWAQKIQQQYDAIQGPNKLKQLGEQLGMDAKNAFEALTLSHEIISGNALKEAEFYRFAELMAETVKTASKVGIFAGSTILTAGATTAAAGYLTLGEAISVTVSGVEVLLEVGSLGSNIILGENNRATIALEGMNDAYGTASAIFGIKDLFGNTDDKLFYVVDRLMDYVSEGEVLGITVTDDPSGAYLDYFKVPTEDGRFPDELSYSELFSKMIDGAIEQALENILKDNDMSYDDLILKLKSDGNLNNDDLINEIEEKEDLPIDEILNEVEKELEGNADEKLEEEAKEDKDDQVDKDKSDKDEDKDDKDKSDKDEDNDDNEEPEDPEDPEEPGDSEGPEDPEDPGEPEDPGDSGDPEDPEDPEDSEDPEDPEEKIYYTLTINYVDFSGTSIAQPFVKKFEYGDYYNIPVPKIDGYTTDEESVIGTMVSDRIETVYYYKNYLPTLFISYVIADGKVEAPESYIGEYKVGDSFSVVSPDVPGYYPDIPVVEGTMPEGGYSQTVTYYNNEKTYTITIRYLYVDEEGKEIGEALETETRDVKVGDSYTITPPIIDGYYSDMDEFTRIMGDVGNINYTIKYRPNPDPDSYEISGIIIDNSVRVPEGTSLGEALAFLPEEIPVYVNAGHATLDIQVEWKENSERAFPIKDEVIGVLPYTGTYKFEGELKLPYNVTNPWGFIPKIAVEIYPVVEDPYNDDLDYSELNRQIDGSVDDYVVYYKDTYAEKQGLWIKYVNGLVYERYTYKDNQYHGIHQQFTGPDNSLSKIAYYRNGELDGPYESWHNNGIKYIEGQYSNGLKTGEWVYYYDSGSKSSEGSYSEGKETGEWKYYHNNGKVKSQGNYSDGKKTGPWEFYYESGNIESKGNFTNGAKKGTWTYYYENGEVSQTINH